MAVTAFVLGFIFLIAFRATAVNKIVGLSMFLARRVTKNPHKLEAFNEKLYHWLSSFGEVFRTFKANPRMLIKPVIFSGFAWFFNILVFLMVFYSLGYTHIGITDLATIYCLVTTVETVTAGFPVGAVEVTMTSLFSLYGVPIAIAAAATTLTRLLTFWCQVVVGYPLVEWVGVKSLLKSNLASGFVVKPPVILQQDLLQKE
jgi:uncharacterized protein (TIRG00374 family)